MLIRDLYWSKNWFCSCAQQHRIEKKKPDSFLVGDEHIIFRIDVGSVTIDCWQLKVLSDQMHLMVDVRVGSLPFPALTSLPALPLLKLISRGDPPCVDDVRPLRTAAEGFAQKTSPHRRQTFSLHRSAALAEWQSLMA